MQYLLSLLGATLVTITVLFGTSCTAEQSPTILDGVELVHLGSYSTGVYRNSAAEIVRFDPVTQRLFVVNGSERNIDVLDISTPSEPTRLWALNVQEGAPNSVAIHQGLVAVAVEAEVKTDVGSIQFFNTDGVFLTSVKAGSLPDMVTFTPDGNTVLVANEGEPNNNYTIDPEGSISIVDISGGIDGLTQAHVTTIGFTAFNDVMLDSSIRIFGPDATVAQDLEPEYITVSSDSNKAWVTLQENNALAVIDLQTRQITELLGLGFKDHEIDTQGLDASDRDSTVNIQRWPVLGMYQPDAIANYERDGHTYLVTANEGDARDYAAFSEETRVSELTLDPAAFPNAAGLQMPDALGRLK
ncbi:MAG: choice-of-anchor I family protein, partial [Vicinamibacterales bacterium]